MHQKHDDYRALVIVGVRLNAALIPFYGGMIPSREHWGKIKRWVDTSTPDIGAVIPWSGRALLLEVKSLTGRLREGQRIRLEELAAAGALCGLVRSVGAVVDMLLADLLACKFDEPDNEAAERFWRAVLGYQRGVGAK